MDRLQDPKSSPSVSVVVPCRNEAANVEALLDSIERQDCPACEIIVVDDRSSDETAAVIERWRNACRGRRVEVLPGPGRGPAAAMNAGITKAKGDLVIRLDGHCRPQPGYIAHSVRTLIETNASVVGGVWEVEAGADTSVAHAIAAVVSHPIGSGGAGYRNSKDRFPAIRSVETVPFGCFRRELWEQLGGYDEGLIANEDFDFNHRARRAGGTVLLNSEVRSVYKARPTLRALAHQYFRYGFWKARMLRKSPESIRMRQLPPAFFLPWTSLVAVGALVSGGLVWLIAAALYPVVVVAAVTHMRVARQDLRLYLPAIASVVVQHAAWSAGFWSGVLYPSSKLTQCHVPPAARPGS